MMRQGLAFVFLLSACTPDTAPLNLLPCDNGECGPRWVCNPTTNLCVPPIEVGCNEEGAVCPSTIGDGDACSSEGSFVPCTDAVSDCSLGCRTCENGAWSECSTPGDCETCTDYFRDDDRDGTGVTGDSQCLCEPTEPYDATTDGDCDDSTETGADCTDTCTTYYVDSDGDGAGNAAISLSACSAPANHVTDDTDCDDSDDSCSDTCSTYYADTDGDGLGDAASAVSACSAPANHVTDDTDCDDGNANCGANCTDGDSDGWCRGIDCNDGDGACTSDCTACPVTGPDALVLTVTSSTPINAGDTVDLEIDLGAYTEDATSDITCTAEAYTIFGPHDFTGQPTPTSLGFAAVRSGYASAPTDAPFDQTPCSAAGDFVQLRHPAQSSSLSLDPQLALDDYGSLELSFVAAAEDGATTSLDVQACCGNGCTPTSVQAIAPGDISGATNACSSQQISIPHDNCAALSINWFWDGGGEYAGLDDVSLDGTVIVPAVTAGAPGIYTTSFLAGPPGTFDITCAWENAGVGPSVEDTESVTIE